MKKTDFVQNESLFAYGEGDSFAVREDDPALENHKTPYSELHKAEALRELETSLELLPTRESDVVFRHYALGESFSEIGAAYGITRERACQLKHAGMKKLHSIFRKRKAKYET